MHTDRVFLVGPMGAGKSTVGRQLAAALDMRFVDSDKLIEERTGASIPLIFDVEGEAGFRRRESAVIDELTGQSGLVVATGGGAVMTQGNRDCLRRGVTVYLQTSVARQLERTRHDRNRPLLQVDNPEARLAELLKVREPLYREVASITVSTDRGTVRAVIRDILAQLEKLRAAADN